MAVQRDTDWVRSLPQAFLACRSIRHQWQLREFESINPGDLDMKLPLRTRQVVIRWLDCLQCEASRADFFSRTTLGKLNGGRFQKFTTRYRYPRGYTFVGKEHQGLRPEAADYHRELYVRLG